MGIFSCDYKDCNRKAYMEIHMPETKDDPSCWCYSCFWHYLISRIRTILGLNNYEYSRVETDREAVEYIRMELWDIQVDLAKIKEKLGIKDDDEDEFETNLDVT